MSRLSFFRPFLFLLFAVPGFSQVRMSPGSHDFGEVRPGTRLSVKVKVSNTSSKAVTLSQPVLNCACATAQLSGTRLEPGAFVWMTLSYSPEESQKGAQTLQARLTVRTAGKKKGETLGTETDFRAKARVLPYYTLAPERLMTTVLKGTNIKGLQGRLELDPKACKDWKLVKVDAGSNTLTAKVEAQGGDHSYSVRLEVPDGLSPGTYQGYLSIQGSGKTATLIRYPYHIVVSSLFDVVPVNLQVRSLDPDSPREWKGMTQVRRLDNKAFKIRKIENTPSWLKYEVKKATHGEQYVIHWQLDKGKLRDKKEMARPLPSNLVLVTDSDLERSVPIALEGPRPDPARTFKAPVPLQGKGEKVEPKFKWPAQMSKPTPPLKK